MKYKPMPAVWHWVGFNVILCEDLFSLGGSSHRRDLVLLTDDKIKLMCQCMTAEHCSGLLCRSVVSQCG